MYFDYHDPLTAVTSYFVSPKSLGIIRLLLALYAICVWAISIFYSAHNNSPAHEWRRYLTNTTFIGLIVYITSAAVHTLIYAFGKQPDNDCTAAAAEAEAGPKTLKPAAFNTRLHFLFYTIFVCMHLGVPIAYWLFLYRSRPHGTDHIWLTLSYHGGDAVVLVVEVLLGRIVLRWTDWFVLLICSTMYISYDVVLHMAASDWAYPVLDWSNGPMVLAFYAGIPVLFSACFLVVMGLHRLRERLGRGRCESVKV